MRLRTASEFFSRREPMVERAVQAHGEVERRGVGGITVTMAMAEV